MKLTLDANLYTVQAVFDGRISRRELSRRSVHEQVFVAHALMLVFPKRYLVDGYQVQGSYRNLLYDLVGRGIRNFYAGGNLDPSPDALVSASRRNGLFTPSPQGRRKRVAISPPTELVELVQELGHTLSLDVFMEDIAAGIEQERVWGQEYAARVTAETRTYDLENAIRTIEENYGHDGLMELFAKLKTHLQIAS